MIVQKIVQARTLAINNQITACLEQEKRVDTLSSNSLCVSKAALEKIRLNRLIIGIFKIVNFVFKIFNRNYSDIDHLLELNILTNRLIQNYSQLIADPNAQIDDAGFVYDVSAERLKKSLGFSDKPVKITMVGVEYAGLIKQGGLAEALEGLSCALSDLGHKVQLIFPKYNNLPEEIAKDLKNPQIYRDSDGEEYKVYRKEVDGISCQFIEHPSFDLGLERPNVYGPDFTSQADRFASFSALAADLIYQQKNTDIIHLHDWHVAGVGLKLKKDHEEEWAAGKIPPVVFTFHNNQRAMQGRLSPGIYSYDPIIKGYQDRGIINHNDNLFVRILMEADAITTVSESFGTESQQVELGSGVSFAVRQAARVGKFTGILNGANLKRWDPKTNPMLCNWKDVETGEAVDLSYSAESPDLWQQKEKARGQLQKWVGKYKADVKIDFSKPLVTFIGRFDSEQKGIDRLEAGIKATLKKGGQFICMGTDEDKTAKEILDRLEKKYKKGVFFIRDFRDKSGKLFYQQGNGEQPGIGSLIRAASDFVLIPSRFEPCGLVQFEGWQFGSLAIGSKTGGLADSITPKNGFLFTGDPTAAIEEALENWQKLGIKEREEIIRKVMVDVKQFDWKQAAEKYRLVYANAMKRRAIRQMQTPTIECLKYGKISPGGPKGDSPEENYLSEFYFQNRDSVYLSPLYQQLARQGRGDLPSPYGKQVDFAKYEKLGSFPDGRFAVSAPNAKKVELLLVSDDEQRVQIFEMTQTAQCWAVTVPHLKHGQKYQYRIDGQIKIDPYAKSHISKHPKKIPYSLVTISEHKWQDESWIKQRKKSAGQSRAMNIYEVHPISWKKRDGRPLNYREFSHELLAHCKEHKYTHVELMGILEHPRDKSWGYQVSGYFAPTSRMGSVDDFKYLVDLLHQNQIGVFLDFVPAHFDRSSFGLDRFDGSHQYDAHGFKHFFSLRNWFYSYSSKHFDYQKREVREFLISSAMYWIKEMHIDGLRVDCVSSMTLGSEHPESANLFLRDLNAVIHNHGQGAISIAEEMEGNKSATVSPAQDGLDFDLKWHAGFMHYMFLYFNTPPRKRAKYYDFIRRGICCDDFNKQILIMSHDQANAFSKLNRKIKNPQKREAQARAIHSLMMCLPGKKVNFMATEGAPLANWGDYVFKKDSGWFDDHILDPKFRAMMVRLNELYQTESAFHEFDASGKDLEWVDDPHRLIHAYRRKNSKGESFICMHNFTDDTERTIRIKGGWEIFNSDSIEFGGAGRVNSKPGIFKVPPLSTIIVKENP